MLNYNQGGITCSEGAVCIFLHLQSNSKHPHITAIFFYIFETNNPSLALVTTGLLQSIDSLCAVFESWQYFSFDYLFSPFAFEGGGCRTVWLSSISTTHFVFSSSSVETSFVGKVKQTCGGVRSVISEPLSSQTTVKSDFRLVKSS